MNKDQVYCIYHDYFLFFVKFLQTAVLSVLLVFGKIPDSLREQFPSSFYSKLTNGAKILKLMVMNKSVMYTREKIKLDFDFHLGKI